MTSAREVPGAELVDAATVAGIRDVMVASDRLRTACARHYGLAQSDILALSHLAAAGGMTPSDLAERLQLTGASVTSVADRLAEGGLVRRVAHPTDRRRIVLELTEPGLARVNAVRVVITRAMAGMADPEHVAAVLTEVAGRLDARLHDVGRLLDEVGPRVAR